MAGTQADQLKKNKILLLKCVNMHRTTRRPRPRDTRDTSHEDSDSDTGSDSDAGDSGPGDRKKKTPAVVSRTMPHYGGVNRVRVRTRARARAPCPHACHMRARS